MILSRAITNIQRGLGFRKAGDNEIINIIADAQEMLETITPTTPLPWFLLTERASTSSVAEEERIQIPSDFIQEAEDTTIWLVRPDGEGEVPLRKYTEQDLRVLMQEYGGYSQENDVERYRYNYALTGEYYRIFPAPRDVYTFKHMYYQRQTVMTDPNETNNWLRYAPWVLIGSAGEELALGLRDTIALQYFQGKKAAAMAAMTQFTVNRDVANRRMAMGETL
jgi:hypothetical protein